MNETPTELPPKRRSRRWLKGLAVLVVLIAVAVWGLNRMMNAPFYVVGSVRAEKGLRGPLAPPPQEALLTQEDETAWKVEPDITLPYQAQGEGRPVLVVHGGPGIPYARPWQALDPLTDRYRFFFYHQRGCGEASRPLDRFAGNFYENLVTLENTLGLGAQVADIERIRRLIGEEKLTLIGHSFGGFLATLYAAEFPERVDKLILVAPAGVLTPPEGERDLFQSVRVQLDNEQRVSFDALMDEYFDFGNLFEKSELELVELHRRLGDYILPAMGYDGVLTTDAPRGGGWAVYAMYISMGRVYDYRPALQRITAPTLILHGSDDDLSLPGAKTYEAIPDSRFRLIEADGDARAGHFVYDDCRDAFGQALSDFLDGDAE